MWEAMWIKLRERVNEIDERCAQGKIYLYDVDGEMYVGSTIQSLDDRDMGHRLNTERNRKKGALLYIAITKRGGWDGVDIQLIENYPCRNKWFLTRREDIWAQILKTSLNTYRPSRNSYDYQQENKDYYAKIKKDWAENNPLKKQAASLKYYEEHKEEVKKRSQERYAIMKQYTPARKLQTHEQKLASRNAYNKKKRLLMTEEQKDKIRERDRLRYERKKQKSNPTTNAKKTN